MLLTVWLDDVYFVVVMVLKFDPWDRLEKG
jgi:hypothetical protein